MSGFPGVLEALLLIALGIGYGVIYLARREDKVLQFIGYMIGSMIIVLAVIYILGNLLIHVQTCTSNARYNRRMMYPHMKPQAPPAQKALRY